jgi:hypothetical protein
VLSRHVDETFSHDTDDERIEFRLEKNRRRFDKKTNPELRYGFTLVQRSPLGGNESGQVAKTKDGSHK